MNGDTHSKIGYWQKCPVCDGVGMVSGGYFLRAGDYHGWTSDKTMESCKVCGGTGLLQCPIINE